MMDSPTRLSVHLVQYSLFHYCSRPIILHVAGTARPGSKPHEAFKSADRIKQSELG